MENKKKASSEAEIRARIKRQVALTRSKNYTPEKIASEYRKYCGIYKACVLDGNDTENPYVWREVFRILMEENNV